MQNRNTGNYMEAFKLLHGVLNFYEVQKDTSHIIRVYHDIAIMYASFGNYNKALEICNLCDQYLKEPGFKKERSAILNVKGLVYLIKGDYEEALNYFLASLVIEKEINVKRRIMIRYENIAIVYAYLRNFEPAFEYLQICLSEHKKSGRWNRVANTYNSLGMCYEQMNIPDSSIHYYLKSIELGEQLNLADLNLKSYLRISTIYNNIGNIDSSHMFLKKYHDSFEKLDKSNLGWKIAAKEFEYSRQKDHKLEKVEKRNKVLINIIIAGVFLLTILILWFTNKKLRIRIYNSQAVKLKLENHKIVLKNYINKQNKELVSKILQLTKYNSEIKFTVKKLMKLKSEVGINSKQKIQQVINDLEHSLNDTIWHEFEYRFIQVHPQLYKKLSVNYSSLTISERRLCALIHLNFSSKEIAHITKQSYEGILVAKSRLRSKLNIAKSAKITDFIHQLTQSN